MSKLIDKIKKNLTDEKIEYIVGEYKKIIAYNHEIRTKAGGDVEETIPEDDNEKIDFFIQEAQAMVATAKACKKTFGEDDKIFMTDTSDLTCDELVDEIINLSPTGLDYACGCTSVIASKSQIFKNWQPEF